MNCIMSLQEELPVQRIAFWELFGGPQILKEAYCRAWSTCEPGGFSFSATWLILKASPTKETWSGVCYIL